MKKTIVSEDYADSLEVTLDDYIQHNGYPYIWKEVRTGLQQVGFPAAGIAALRMKLDSLVEDINALKSDMTRCSTESVVDGYKQLDEYLGRCFLVTRSTGKGKKLTAPYWWAVGA
jgi:hypothetical protein